MAERTVSLVTFFNPNGTHANNVRAIAAQSDVAIVVDNSKADNSRLFGTQPEDKAILYVSNARNLGLSAAFNACLTDVDRFAWNEDDYVVFFDQDTHIEPGHIEALRNEFEALRQRGYKVGCIGPAYYEANAQKTRIPKVRKAVSPTSMLVEKVITSSMLTTYGNLKSVGFWSDDIFLDMADYDLCWKMRSHGYVIALTTKSVIVHEIGESSSNMLLRPISQSKPFREYYQMRDRLYLLKKPYVPLASKTVLLYEVTLQAGLRLATSADRAERFRYMRLGRTHFRSGIHDPLAD